VEKVAEVVAEEEEEEVVVVVVVVVVSLKMSIGQGRFLV
jgi:hypothetical protein